MIGRQFGPEASVLWRLYVLFLLASAAREIPAEYDLPVLAIVLYLLVSLANRITNPVTCFRCRNACQHEPPFGDLPAIECSAECSERPEEWPCLPDCPSRRNHS